MQYYISSSKPHTRYIEIKAILSGINSDFIEIQLPSWRPGRYELGNFAKNVRNFSVKDYTGFEVPLQKITKDRWKVFTKGQETVEIFYEYFAAEANAGSTYTSTDLLYINPVNCLVYAAGFEHLPCTVHLLVHENFMVGCQLHKIHEHTLEAKNFDALADAPILASPALEHHSIKILGTDHHVWIYGTHHLDISRLLENMTAYTEEQIHIFAELEGNEFHYLYLFLPTAFRHGVEHSNSTVIAMGPSSLLHTDAQYKSLLAISSHELFHLWNVKRIRPASMFPYDFTKENYSALGYIYEGVTTYYGDYMLLRSGVWDFEQWSAEISDDFSKHMHNEGRYHYSVANSSLDTWLDGYVAGAPGRKVSIYTEGMLAAFMLDIEIRYVTANDKSLDDVMQSLYGDYYKKQRGYTEDDLLQVINKTGGKDFSFFFKDFFNGTGNIEKFLPETLWSIGLEIKEENAAYLHENLYGFALQQAGNTLTVTTVATGSPADVQGISVNDRLLHIHGLEMRSAEDVQSFLLLHGNDPVKFVLKDAFSEKEMILEKGDRNYFKNYRIVKMQHTEAHQREFYKKWCKKDF